MASLLDRFWTKHGAEKRALEETLGPIKTVTEFLADAIEATKDNEAIKTLATAVKEAAPWGAVLGAAAEAVTPIKFLVKLFEKLTEETDPKALGYLACTMAYERSVEQALEEIGGPGSPRAFEAEVRRALESLDAEEVEFDFARFAFDHPASDPFVAYADARLRVFAESAGYGAVEVRRLIRTVHSLFGINLKLILADGKLEKKFAPFLKLMGAGSEDHRASESLADHAAFQLWKYEEAPVFDSEPFSLRNIYVATECGRLKWGDILESQESSSLRGEPQVTLDPFYEGHGGRQDLVQTVMDLIVDPEYSEAIVVQGVAGSPHYEVLTA